MTTNGPGAKNTSTPVTVPMDPGQSVAGRASDPAFPLDTWRMDWIPTGPGKSFRPLRFEPGGWSELMRLEPGSVVALHRHTDLPDTPRHLACGTAIEARWYCPTCDQLVDHEPRHAQEYYL